MRVDTRTNRKTGTRIGEIERDREREREEEEGAEETADDTDTHQCVDPGTRKKDAKPNKKNHLHRLPQAHLLTQESPRDVRGLRESEFPRKREEPQGGTAVYPLPGGG